MRFPAVVALTALLVVACGGDDAAACVELREPEDPGSGLHVLTDGAATYLTDPPTSGPHIAGPTPSGTLDGPVATAIQVRLLEAGGVMVQYDQRVDTASVEALAGVADDMVVVAPATDTLPEPIVATAWTWKLSCSTIDLDRLATFIEERPAAAPGLD